MASSDLRSQLSCSVCLSIYTDPVTLNCGHNFCQTCTKITFDSQEVLGVYSCPECRAEFQVRPELQKNTRLCNIVEYFLSLHPEQQKENEIFCTYCGLHVPAVKTCLLCEASLCYVHLKKHSNTVEHVLTEPTSSFKSKKCSIHNEILKYYCSEDSDFVCVSCCLAGEHRGHKVELLNEVVKKKKKKLRNIMKKLNSKREKITKRFQILQQHQIEVQKTAVAESDRIAAMFGYIRVEVKELEKQVLGAISRQGEQSFLQVSNLIQQLELTKEELSWKMGLIEEVCNLNNPVTVMRDEEEYYTGYVDSDGDRNVCVKLDLAPVSLILHRGLLYLSDVLLDLTAKQDFPPLETSDISMDINTASNWIEISSDLKSATCTSTDQNRPDLPERFESKQVLSANSFSSGRHYWEVDVSEAKEWLIGVAYPSIERKIDGEDSHIGYNDKSWALTLNPCLVALHNNKWKPVDLGYPVRSVGIFLDYEAGHLSFYQLRDPVRHLHTFAATFTEPLHAAFFIITDTCIRIAKQM